MTRERYRVADLTIDVGAVSVERGGEALALPPLSFDLLVALVRRAPDVVAADELIAAVWQGTVVSDEALTQRVALLRRALGDTARRPGYVRSVRGRGYQLVAKVVRLAADPPVPPSGRGGAGALAGVVGAIAVVIVVAAVAAWLLGRPEPAEQGPVRTAAPTVAELVARADGYLRRHTEADNELAIELYQQALGRAPDDTSALTGLSFGLAQRATKFNRDRGEAAGRALVLADRALTLRPDLARAHHARALALDARGRVSMALAAYLRAAELEPDDRGALASAANQLQVQGELASALRSNLEAAAAGIETPYLEVQIGTTLALLGFEVAATVWLERASELRPDNVFAAAAFAHFYLRQGRLQEARATAEAGLDRGIRRPELHLIRGHVALIGGDEEAARRAYEAAAAIDPAAASATARRLALDARRYGPDGDLRRSYVEEVAALRAAREDGDEWPDLACVEALLHVAFAALDEAFAALDTCVALGWRDADWWLVDPALAGVRELPRFRSRIDEVRALVAAQREAVLVAPWLPPTLLMPTAEAGSADST